MSMPLSQDYNEAIQNPQSSFGDPELRGGQAVCNALGMPLPRSGNFADVYEFVGASGAKWAVKCFTREVPGLQDRYSEISKHLAQANLPFTVDFEWLGRGIRIRNECYPVLKMKWVEGFLLNEFVRNNLTKPTLLDGLGQIWLRMAKRLRDANLAHADLQHGNVILVPGAKASSLAVRLIDYDGMWVPALAKSKSGEVGHPNYQHPQRLREGIYSADVDRLPLLAVACALRCLVVGGKSLWDRYDNGDNLLFKETDLKTPAQSALFKELQAMRDPQARTLVQELHTALQRKLDEVPAIGDVLAEPKPVRASVPASPPPLPPATPSAPVVKPRSHFDFDEPIETEPAPKRRSGASGWALLYAGGAAVALLFGAAIAGIAWMVLSKGDANVVWKKPAEDGVRQDGKKQPKTDEPRPVELFPPKDPKPSVVSKELTPNPTQPLPKPLEPKNAVIADVAQRRASIFAFYNEGPKAAGKVPELIEFLRDDKDAKVREFAALALGGIGKASEPAIPLLVEKLKDAKENRLVRIESAMALARIGPVAAATPIVPTLLELLTDPQQDPKVRERIVWALRIHSENLRTMQGPLEAFTQILKESVNLDKKMLRYDCAYMLGMIWQAKAPDVALDVLSEFLSDAKIKIYQGTVAKPGEGIGTVSERGAGDGRVLAMDALKMMGIARYGQREDIMKQLRVLAADDNLYKPLQKKAIELVVLARPMTKSIELTAEKGKASWTGQLSELDGLFKKNHYKLFAFRMEAGKTYKIDMQSDAFEPHLILSNADDAGFDAPIGKGRTVSHTAKETGMHHIIATHSDGKLGEFTLIVEVHGPIELKDDKGKASWTGELAASDLPYKEKKHHKLFTFAMDAGKSYQIEMKSGAFDSYLYLTDADGARVAENDSFAGAKTSLDSRITYKKAKKSGNYQIIATHRDDKLGPFTLTVRLMEDYIRTKSGLQFLDSQVGSGETAQKGHTVTIHYTATLNDGTKFDSTLERGTPATFLLGAGKTIKGLDEGILGMKVDGKRKLIIPPPLAYGTNGSKKNGILPNAVLRYEVELVSVQTVIQNSLVKADRSYTWQKRQYKHHKVFLHNMVMGQTYQLDMTSTELNSFLFLQDPDGKVIALDDNRGGGLNARIVITAARSGPFRIIATDFGEALGPFTITIQRR